MTPTRFSKTLLALSVCFAAIHCARSQRAGARENDPPVIPLAVNVTNGNVVFFWPVQPSPTELQKRPLGPGIWKTVPESFYRTNNSFVTATLPLSNEEFLYRIKRWPVGRKTAPVASPPFIPTPAPVTNRPPHPKTPTPSP